MNEGWAGLQGGVYFNRNGMGIVKGMGGNLIWLGMSKYKKLSKNIG